MDELTGWDFVKIAYVCGAVVAGSITFRLTSDPSVTIRLLCAVLIAYTWPLSLLVVLVIGMF
ncbi:GhoT/OrtT family toxin [Acerihabitans sp. TG2]|uniref:GhoT/OrtT family toxin n=1 Tax=Acerihabitans sp. TG2 TaxID=3096008 RepID=UPI002B224332|nr:GhoT/OrtT family toxin [Acerihabitans sp. TG2]MEA9391908.1 GhoT/OrtT family toxin [Acerihabitans sp. TG2]